MNHADIERTLTEFGFTPKEARVFLTVLQNPNATGYQLAKILNLSRSTVYDALNSLYDKGAVYLVPGDPNRYLAKDVREFFTSLKDTFSEKVDRVIDSLEQVSVSSGDVHFIHINGYTNTTQKIREMFSSARIEIFINCRMDLHIFAEEIAGARERGVRIIVFTYDEIDYSDLDMELYAGDRFRPVNTSEQNIVLVADMERAIIAHGDKKREFAGTYSEHEFYVGNLASYINLDVTLFRIEEHLGERLDIQSIALDTYYARKWFSEEE